jgi:hypothetical protein
MGVGQITDDVLWSATRRGEERQMANKNTSRRGPVQNRKLCSRHNDHQQPRLVEMPASVLRNLLHNCYHIAHGSRYTLMSQGLLLRTK